MILKNFTYRGLNMSDSQAQTNGFILTRETHALNLTTASYSRQSGHGAVTGYSVSGGRLFTFSGKLFGATPAERQSAITRLESVIRPEGIPGAGLYPLTFETAGGRTWSIQAKVYSGLQLTEAEDEGFSPVIGFTFELFAEDPAFVSQMVQMTNAGASLVGGMLLPTHLPGMWNLAQGTVTVTNGGNTDAPVCLRVQGTAINPCIRNITTGKFYKLATTTADLVLDNRTRGVVIEDAGANVKAYRTAGSEYITLVPGVNNLRLTLDNWMVGVPITFSITFNDPWLA